MLNLAVPLSQGVFRFGGNEIPSVKVRQMCKVHQVVIPAEETIEELEFDCGPYSATLKPPFTPSAPVQKRLQGPPAKSKFLAASGPIRA
jgi:hypothetical protein